MISGIEVYGHHRIGVPSTGTSLNCLLAAVNGSPAAGSRAAFRHPAKQISVRRLECADFNLLSDTLRSRFSEN